jgi:hypothetical protein
VDRGERERDRELLGPLFQWFTEGFDMGDLAAAKAPLADLD